MPRPKSYQVKGSRTCVVCGLPNDRPRLKECSRCASGELSENRLMGSLPVVTTQKRPWKIRYPGRRTVFTSEMDRQLIELREKGLSVVEISREIGPSDRVVSRRLEELGYPLYSIPNHRKPSNCSRCGKPLPVKSSLHDCEECRAEALGRIGTR